MDKGIFLNLHRGIEGRQQELASSLSYNQVLPSVAGSLRAILAKVPAKVQAHALELRIRQGRPLALVIPEGIRFVAAGGGLSMEPKEGHLVTEEECRLTLQLMTRSSMYMVQDQLAQGFVTLPGGHRVGIGGTAFVEQGEAKTIRDISQFSIRIAKELPGVASRVVPAITDARGRVLSTLVVSPPGCGKTTLIRDIARQLSWGKTGSWRCHTVAIVDERGEIAATWQGEPQMDVGPCTDVLDGYPKIAGIMVAIRALTPEVLITDELGTAADAQAVIQASAAGVAVVASIHGSSWESIKMRPGGSLLAESQVFRRLIFLGKSRGPGTIEKIQVLS